MSEHYHDCNGNSSAMSKVEVIAMGTVVLMSKVEGSWICYQVYVIQQLPTMLMYCNPVMRISITGTFKGYFLSVHMANLSATG